MNFNQVNELEMRLEKTKEIGTFMISHYITIYYNNIFTRYQLRYLSMFQIVSHLFVIAHVRFSVDLKYEVSLSQSELKTADVIKITFYIIFKSKLRILNQNKAIYKLIEHFIC
jgi:hypothetical protein